MAGVKVPFLRRVFCVEFAVNKNLGFASRGHGSLNMTLSTDFLSWVCIDAARRTARFGWVGLLGYGCVHVLRYAMLCIHKALLVKETI